MTDVKKEWEFKENVISGSAWTCTCAKEKCICLQKKQENKKSWADRFEEEFIEKGLEMEKDGNVIRSNKDLVELERIKSFISTLLQEEKKICEEAIRNYCYDHKDCYKAIESERQRIIGIMKRLKLEFDTVICACGDKWGESDAADIVNQALNDLKDKIK